MDWRDVPCKLWGDDPNRYGMKVRDGKTISRHRLAYIDAHGPIPPGMEVCHHCDTPACYELAHLFLGTHWDNMQDMATKGRGGRKPPTHCVHGHEFTPENTHTKPGRKPGQVIRNCRACNNTRNRLNRAQAAEEKRLRPPRTHCGHGHALTPENIRIEIDKKGVKRTRCLPCARVKCREYRQRKAGMA